VPLRVQVYPTGSDKPAFEVAFTHVSFGRPDAAQFRFVPPPGAQVKEEGTAKQVPGAATAPQRPTIVGNGWTSVLVAKPPNAKLPNGLPLEQLPTVSGAWGRGHLLAGRLFSVLLTDDGRVLAGAVPPEQLYAAAG
jgi:hypothetical protein